MADETKLPAATPVEGVEPAVETAEPVTTPSDAGFSDVPGVPGLSFRLGPPQQGEGAGPGLDEPGGPGADDIGPRYGATRAASEEMDAVEALEDKFGADLDAEEAGIEPTAAEPPAQKATQPGAGEAEEGDFDLGAILSDLGRGSLETPLQSVGGVRDAAQETMEAMDSLAIWLNTHVADLTVLDPETAPRFDLPDVPQPVTVTGGVIRGIVQFTTGMVGAGKFTGLSKLKNLSKVGAAGRLGLQGAIADAIARDPNEENLADLIRELSGEQENAVLNFMASDPEDSEAVARLKKAFEGFGVGALIDGLILGLGALRASRGLRKAGEAAQDRPIGQQPGQTQAEIDALAKSPKQSAKEASGVATVAAGPVVAENDSERDPNETEVAGLGTAVVKAFRKAQRGADEIARQRTGTGAVKRTLLGGEDRALVERIERNEQAVEALGERVRRFLDNIGARDSAPILSDLEKEAGEEAAARVTKASSPELAKLIAVLRGDRKPPPPPQGLLGFLRSKGGVQDQGGDLAAMGINSRTRPGFVNKKGQPLDSAGERAFEAGFFRERPTVSELLEAIDGEFSSGNLRVRDGDLERLAELENLSQLDEFVNQADLDLKSMTDAQVERSLFGLAEDEARSLADLDLETKAMRESGIRFDETGAPPLPSHAININLGKLDTTDDIKRAIDETAKLFPGDIDEARRGIQTNEATSALASDMGLTVEQLLRRRRGEAFNAETALAARRMLASSASQLVDLAKAAADNGGDRELLAFRRAMVIHKAIQEQVSGLTAEAGRALQSFKILAATENEMTRNVQEMIDAAGGSKISRRMAERLADAAETGALTRGQLNQVVRKSALSRTSDAMLEVWINGLLSGPQTQVVNVTSNALVALWQVPTRLIASQLPGGGADAVKAGEAKALLYGMMRGYSEGLILAGRALRTGESTDVLAKIDLPQRRAISAEAFNMSGVPGQAVDLLGETVRLPGRFLVAGDELFKSVGYRMELNARAFREAASEGLEGDAMARRMDEIMRNPPEDIRLAAIDAGRYQTFTKPLGEGGQAFQGVVNAVPALRLITPFIRTPVNIMKFVGEGTVLAPLSRNVRAEFAAGGARRQMATAKIAMGSMASAFAADLAGRGLLTGNGPSDPDTRKIWLTTHQPNSMKIGDEWVAFSRLEPLGAFFGIAADISLIMGQLDEPDRQNLATALVIAVGKNVTSKTYLRGLSEAARVMNEPDRYGERYIQQFAGTLIPTIGAQVTRAGLPGIVDGDPVLRDVRSIYDKLCSRVPGCSTSLPPRRNIWGEPIVLGGGIGPDIMSPIYTNKVVDDPVSTEILRLGVSQKMPSRQIMGIELTPQEYDAYSQIAGQSAKEELTKLMKRSDYKKASDGPDGLKALAIKKVFQETRAAARGRILKDKKFVDLLDRVEERNLERRRKIKAPATPPGQTGLQLPSAGTSP